MQNIKWKPIEGYENLYMVSNTGLIKSLHWKNGKQIHLENGEVKKKV